MRGVATRLALLIGLLLVPPSFGIVEESAPIRLLYVGPAEGSEARGVARGLEEANHLGQFTGHRFVVETSWDEGGAAPTAVLVARETDAVEDVVAQWAAQGVAVLNLAARDAGLRRRCRANLLHVVPSDSMVAAAEAQWRGAHPEGPAARALAWHPEFVKYAARDLNKRFRASQGVAMDDGAWAGWAAVRMVAEAVVRTTNADPPTALAYLRDALVFDGQKGIALTFHPSGQLRQPLLLVAEGELVGEAPVRGVADIEDLDSLGLEPCGSEDGEENE